MVPRPAGITDRRGLYRWCRGQQRGGPHLDEDELIREAQRGDVAAFERLARRYEKPAFRPAFLIVGDAAEAEDATGRALFSVTSMGPPSKTWYGADRRVDGA